MEDNPKDVTTTATEKDKTTESQHNAERIKTSEVSTIEREGAKSRKEKRKEMRHKGKAEDEKERKWKCKED